MKRKHMLVAHLLLLTGVGACGGEATAQTLKLTAYINQAWGCQKATEALLRELDTKYGERVSLEIVDFGGKGRKRWLADGMKCMGVKIGASTSAEIVHKGAALPVRFEMPAGYQWTHEELALAVRQRLLGVSAADRRPPRPEVRLEDGKAVLVVDGSEVLRLADRVRMEAVAEALHRAASSGNGLTREDFTLATSQEGVTVLAKELTVVEVTPGDASGDKGRVRLRAEEWLAAVAAPYPVLTRPFPGRQHPRGR